MPSRPRTPQVLCVQPTQEPLNQESYAKETSYSCRRICRKGDGSPSAEARLQAVKLHGGPTALPETKEPETLAEVCPAPASAARRRLELFQWSCRDMVHVSKSLGRESLSAPHGPIPFCLSFLGAEHSVQKNHEAVYLGPYTLPGQPDDLPGPTE